MFPLPLVYKPYDVCVCVCVKCMIVVCVLECVCVKDHENLMNHNNHHFTKSHTSFKISSAATAKIKLNLALPLLCCLRLKYPFAKMNIFENVKCQFQISID